MRQGSQEALELNLLNVPHFYNLACGVGHIDDRRDSRVETLLDT